MLSCAQFTLIFENAVGMIIKFNWHMFRYQTSEGNISTAKCSFPE